MTETQRATGSYASDRPSGMLSNVLAIPMEARTRIAAVFVEYLNLNTLDLRCSEQDCSLLLSHKLLRSVQCGQRVYARLPQAPTNAFHPTTTMTKLASTLFLRRHVIPTASGIHP